MLKLTKDDIIRMAREAGFESYDISLNFPKEIERFFNAAYAAGAAAEREACAERAWIALVNHKQPWNVRQDVTEAIRARGQQ